MTTLDPIIDTCDFGHKFAKLPDHPVTPSGAARCPHCLVEGLFRCITNNGIMHINLEWIANVNATYQEYQDKARDALRRVDAPQVVEKEELNADAVKNKQSVSGDKLLEELTNIHARLNSLEAKLDTKLDKPPSISIEAFRQRFEQPGTMNCTIVEAVEQTMSQEELKKIFPQLGTENTEAGLLPVPYSEKSTSSEAAAELLKQAHEALAYHIRGPKSLFVKYLSPLTINGGRGFIKVSNDYKQYVEDIFTATPQRLFGDNWVSGFYRDKETTDMQMLIKLPSCILLINNLPNHSGAMHVLRKLPDGVSFEILSRIVGLTYKELAVLHDELEKELMKITDHYFKT